MSGRGTPLNIRPITPVDPTLAVHPVPHDRTFVIRSVGPGAAADIKITTQSFAQLYTEANLTALGSKPQELPRDEISSLLNLIENDQQWHGSDDPTWGFYVFVTSYADGSRAKLPRAIEILSQAIQRSMLCRTKPPYSKELVRRFKLDIIEDQSALAEASDDRIRAEFRTHVYNRICSSQDFDKGDGDVEMWSSARNMAYLVLNEAAVGMLADLTLPDDWSYDHLAFKEKTIKVVDGFWVRPPGSGPSEYYRGVGHCPLPDLPRLYQEVTRDSCGSVEQFFEWLPYW
jgi:hypothetical protein